MFESGNLPTDGKLSGASTLIGLLVVGSSVGHWALYFDLLVAFISWSISLMTGSGRLGSAELDELSWVPRYFLCSPGSYSGFPSHSLEK